MLDMRSSSRRVARFMMRPTLRQDEDGDRHEDQEHAASAAS